MMPLQKSFSEQNHSSKNSSRPQWQRNKSYQNAQQQRSNPPSKPLAEKPPIPVSTATKNILSNFQYREPSNSNSKEDGVINLVSSEEQDQKENPASLKRSRTVGDVPADEHSFFESPLANVPSTPCGFDPTENADFKRPVKSISPDERLLWDANNEGRFPCGGNLGKRKRGHAETARARSSSPIMENSSPGDASLPRNPQPGPEVDIWKFAPKDHKLSHIMDMSSPHAAREDKRGLTRSRSLGNQLKRHQPNRIGGNSSGNVDTPGLMRRLQQDYQKPTTFPNGPSSSSPLPEVSKFPSQEPSSPLKGIHERTSPRKQRNSRAPSPLKKVQSRSPKKSAPAESDYGSDDSLDEIGDLLLTEIESQTQIATSATSVSRSFPPRNVPPAKVFTGKQTPSAQSLSRSFPPLNKTSPTKAKPPAKSKSPTPITESSTLKDDEEDEFGEGLDDADFEEIFSTAAVTVAPSNKVVLPPLKPGASVVKEDSDDEYGDGIDDADFEEIEIAATQAQQKASSIMPSMRKERAIQRYLVTSVLDSEYEGPNGRQMPEKILILQSEHSKSTKLVHLRGFWIETPVNKQAFVHIIGDFDLVGRCIVDNNSNLIILHPDHLLSALAVADSFNCTRLAVLQDRIKATGEAAPPMVYGTLLHEIFQAAMLANRWDTVFLHNLISDIAQRHLEDLYVIKTQIPQAVEHLMSKMPEIQSWAELFVSSQPKPGAMVKSRNGDTAGLCVSKLLDVEEHVWSPMYGLKGNIDATVQVTMKDGQGQQTLTVPFEVKTGKNASASHRAQTALYNLLISDRYDIEIAYGILYYTETSETIRIPAIRQELIHMIMQRNELACFVRERPDQLPPMLKKQNQCGRCYAKTTCFIYHKLADDGDGETSGMKAKFDEVVQHLTPLHKEFFLKWDDLLTKEERESMKFRRELWTMLSSQREKVGRCFSNVIIEPGSAYEEASNPKINRYRYNMIKQSPKAGFSFLDSEINVGEPIVISDEKGHFALAKGYVTHVRKARITVAVDRRLHNARIRQPGFDETDNQVFASIMEVAHEGSTQAESTGKIVEPPILYRLDKDEFSNGLASVRNNLIQIMADGSFGAKETRNRVVDLHPPRFKKNATQYTLTDRASINIDQRRAIEKVMSAQDYALVLGMPGTGKTTTIAHIIRALVSQGKSVLLTSYTHTAVDNILLKLRHDSIPILRLGTAAKIHPEVQEFAQLAATKRDTFEEIRAVWHDTPIVATSCLGIGHPIFNERTFDYCIVDEASQITLPVCVGPIRMARTFILVGDHYQLPPLVKNEDARKGGLDISLFKYLSDAHPQSVVYLEHQYRMNKDIMALSNTLIYSNRLKCGSEAVAEREIEIPDIDAIKSCHYTADSFLKSQGMGMVGLLKNEQPREFCKGGKGNGECWLRDVLDPKRKVIFVDTDSLGEVARESKRGNRVVNECEAEVVRQVVEALIITGVEKGEIGVMTHYKSQLALLKEGISGGGRTTSTAGKMKESATGEVEMHTADRFQGRDKEVVVLSLVRSNADGRIGDLLRDWRRINVAFTRAKTKLIVVGSRGTLRRAEVGGDAAAGREWEGREKVEGVEKGGGEDEEEMVSKFVKLMEERDWVYGLSKEQYMGHVWEKWGTQTQGSVGVGSQWRVKEEKKIVKEVKKDVGMERKRKTALGGNGSAEEKENKMEIVEDEDYGYDLDLNDGSWDCGSYAQSTSCGWGGPMARDLKKAPGKLPPKKILGGNVNGKGGLVKNGKAKHNPKRIRGGLKVGDGNGGGMKMGSVLMDVVNEFGDFGVADGR